MLDAHAMRMPSQNPLPPRKLSTMSANHPHFHIACIMPRSSCKLLGSSFSSRGHCQLAASGDLLSSRFLRGMFHIHHPKTKQKISDKRHALFLVGLRGLRLRLGPESIGQSCGNHPTVATRKNEDDSFRQKAMERIEILLQARGCRNTASTTTLSCLQLSAPARSTRESKLEETSGSEGAKPRGP